MPNFRLIPLSSATVKLRKLFFRPFSKNIAAKSKALHSEDKTMFDLIKMEEQRQRESLNLIASENYASSAVLEALGTCLTNKYSEGYPGRRYYGGNQFIDKIETLCKRRALEAFGLDPTRWGVNVQPYSGSIANFIIFSAVLRPFEKVMGLGLSSGGHLSHGYYSGNRNVNCSSKFFSSLSYELDRDTGLVDYASFAKTAKTFCPRLIVVGGSAYPRDWNYGKFHEVAEESGAVLMSDISHTSGLVSANLLNDPFEFSDIVMTTTHKTLGGPRGALIFYRSELQSKIDFSVFPHCQGGPHNNNIAAIAVQLEKVKSEGFKRYAKNTVLNAAALSNSLQKKGFVLSTGGTDTHLILWNLRRFGVSAFIFEKFCEAVNISVNKNTIFGDSSAFKPSGVRLGSAALTSRGLLESDFKIVAEFLIEAAEFCKELSLQFEEEKVLEILEKSGQGAEAGRIADMKSRVTDFSRKFSAPGIDA